MLVFPNAKLNIGLQIIGRREDGYHLLKTCFYPIPLKDCLELIPRQDKHDDRLIVSGAKDLSADVQNNLVLRAVRLLREDYDFLALDLYLHKLIPNGAGLGGGSSDASFTLKAINELFDLGLSMEKLEAYALKLGADCPFFIQNQPALGEGIGEQLTPMDLDLSGYHLVLIKPDIHISTAEAFQGLRSIGEKDVDLLKILKQKPEKWLPNVSNDFEGSFSEKFPQIEKIKAYFYELGAEYASMTGSGSAVFALFKRKLNKEELEAFAPSFSWQTLL